MPAINALYGPEASKLVEEGKTSEARALFKSYQKISFAWGAVISITVIALGYAIIGFATDEPPSPTIMIALGMLTAGQTVNCATGPVAVNLYVNGHTAASAVPIFCYALVYLILVMFNTANFGSLGAAVTTMLGVALLNIYQYRLARKKGTI